MTAGSEAAEVGEPAPETTPAVPRRSLLTNWTVQRWDVLLAGLLSLATFAVHSVGYVLSAPFWVDEAWVAIAARLPLHDLTRVASSTPVGWSLLLRMVPFGGPERLRLVPLLFAALTVLLSYLYARSLPWHSVFAARLAGVLAGTAALLTPSALVRNDLKQYTADACVTLLMLLLVLRVERSRTRRRIFTVAGAAIAAFLFSAVALFAAAAAFAALVLVDLGSRRWRQAAEVAAVGALTGGVLGLVFVLLYRPGLQPGLNAYWSHYYLPIQHGWGATGRYLDLRSAQMATYLGMGPLLLAVFLVLGGVATVARLRCPASAVFVPLLLVEAIVLGALKLYPLFDERTSHFLTTALAVTAAVGVAGAGQLLTRLNRRAPVAVAVVAVALFVTGVHGHLRARSIPVEDVRAPTRYVEAHRRPGDIIVVAQPSNWGFAYYWPHGRPQPQRSRANLAGFIAYFPDQHDILVTPNRARSGVDRVMDRAAALAAHVGPDARIWVIHTHVLPAELAMFSTAAVDRGFVEQPLLTGNELTLLTRAG